MLPPRQAYGNAEKRRRQQAVPGGKESLIFQG